MRSDGFVYGTGTVIKYVSGLPHALTHTIRLDNPPESGAPDEFGRVYTRDPEKLAYHHAMTHELEVI